jgi:hypothetical protein
MDGFVEHEHERRIMGFKMTTLAPATIVGWDCTPITFEGEPMFECSPSDEYIRDRAYFRFVTQTPPGATPFANWITAEEDFIAVGGNNLPALD